MISRAAGFAILACLFSCGRVAEGTKGALNKGGEIAGTAATEVIEGVATGVEKSWSIDVQLSEALVQSGLSLGKVVVEGDSAGRSNRLILYLISANDFDGTLQAIAVDQQGREFGRATLPLRMETGSADFHTIQFQSRTDLERKSRVVIR
ncbi:MAG: hypothetical protein IPM46_08960 [Flavobacteriales bacterium]|nr:hypothetical protein [Flavobacteriales bacterium]